VDIFITYQNWFWPLLLLCILCGAVYATVLYVLKDRFLVDVSKMWRTVLWILRFTAVTLLAFFLLGPHINTVDRETEKPVVVVALDNSESLLSAQDSSYYFGEYQAELDMLTQRLAEHYDVRTYLFGDEVRQANAFDFSDKHTDMAGVFNEIENRFANRNLGAIVLASDGIYNTGTSPLYASRDLKVPVYTIALGDTTVKRDLICVNVAHNRLAYLGNDFPLEVVLEAHRLAGQSTRVQVRNSSGLLFDQALEITDNNFLTTVPIRLEAKKTGLQRFTVQLVAIDGEVTVINNSMDVFIDVLDSRQQVLILADAPHPDIAALKTAIRSNQNYEVTSSVIDDFDGNVEQYSLVILHQVPSRRMPAQNILDAIDQAGTPVMYVLGQNSNYSALQRRNIGIQISIRGAGLNPTGATMEGDFSLFNLDDGLKRQVEESPPLHTAFGNWKMGKGTVPLFYQKIGNIRTKDPLMVFGKNKDTKFGVLAGEGIWRWKLFDFNRNNSHDNFNQLVTKTVQYLAAKEDKSYFRVYCENTFLENESIEFAAELYNDSYELINEPEVSLTIKNAEGKEFPYAFSKSGNGYTLDAGSMPVGEYTYIATTSQDGKRLTESGEFNVNKVQLELAASTADHNLLYQLADKNEGQMVYPNNISQIADLINARDEIAPVYFTSTRTTDLINWKWIFFVILGLLAIEWFTRKRLGAY